ncbi:hypothetical protein [Donghicola tyrosinivorans]|uniref:Uncharacterized protein n=1 Tax=Donghicola tyrosinivorans TaxID=1652492 RepID=A0A2T0WNG4_9RHOB|nr:hypothetical protein [Donghicola tyrosinivorans]PRY88248.1 hypothetical protein CLV74_10852 [Donghicola tyrosinivorans]
MLTALRRIDKLTFQLMTVAFVGIHIPLTALVVYGLINGFAGLITVLLIALAATLVSTAVSLAVIVKLRTVSSVGPEAIARA